MDHVSTVWRSFRGWLVPNSRRRQAEHDAEDIVYVLTRYWNRVDFNRIPEHDMDEFVRRHPAAASAWAQIKQKYGL